MIKPLGSSFLEGAYSSRDSNGKSSTIFSFCLGFPGGASHNEPACQCIKFMGSIPGSGRSPGAGHGKPPQYSCLENPMKRGARQTTVHGVTKSQTRQSDFTFTSLSCTGEGNGNALQYSCLENPMKRGAWRATDHGGSKSQDMT